MRKVLALELRCLLTEAGTSRKGANESATEIKLLQTFGGKVKHKG